MNPPRTALSQQLLCTAQFLGLVLSGHSSDEALEACPTAMRPGTQALGFAVLRHLGLAQALLGIMARQKQPPQVRHLLLTALALLSAEHAAGEPAYDAFTLVNQAVDAAKKQPATRHASGFVNACLRRFLREAESLLAQARQQESAQWNHPSWWVQRMQQDYPQDWQALLAAARRKAPMVLRSAPLANAPPSAPTRQGIALTATQAGEFAWALHQAVPVEQIDGFSQGNFSVQDAAAQLAAPLLLRAIAPSATPPARRLRILDACAAPGGKTVHLLECARAWGWSMDVIALDMDAQRCQRIHHNLRRCGLEAQVKVADASQPQDWWDGQGFDGILLDAPCSASGIVRRHPDVPWLRRPTDIDQLAHIQRQLLDALWPLLRPDGKLLYCTCSQFKAEGVDQARSFLARNTQAQLLPSPGHLLAGLDRMETLLPENPQCCAPISPSSEGLTGWAREHDGFFYALFEHTR